MLPRIMLHPEQQELSADVITSGRQAATAGQWPVAHDASVAHASQLSAWIWAAEAHRPKGICLGSNQPLHPAMTGATWSP